MFSISTPSRCTHVVPCAPACWETAECVEEVEFSAAILGYYADNGTEFLKDEPIDLLDGEGSALIRRFPIGPLLGIMPWNFPYYQVARFAGPNLVAGNTIILKHAESVPGSALAVAQLMKDAGVPDGAYVNVFASHPQIETIIGDPRIAGVSLTGSERAGAVVASIAGKHGQGWLAAYSATKAGLVGLSQGAHMELGESGVQVTALCPAFVATDMTDWVEGVAKEDMIQPEDLAEAVRYLLRTSRACIVPEMQFVRPGEAL